MHEQVKKFVDALKADDENAGLEAAAAIVSQLLGDVGRVANALDAIAKNLNEGKST
jgi:hypothetical protein